MSYVLVEDVPASWDQYRSIARSLGRPPGLLLHAAGPTDEGFRIVEVWASEEDWQRHALLRSLPEAAIDPLVGAPPVIRDLHAEHVVLGDALNPRTRAVTPARGTSSSPTEDER
jgi:hypothetical protein